jgi:N6-adenosine-specific RNA methylase IME4
VSDIDKDIDADKAADAADSVIKILKRQFPHRADSVFSDFGAIPRGRYGVIYADPPWYFKVWGKQGTGRGAFSHYNLMSAEDLLALPVGDLAARDCMLFIGVPVPLREQGMDLIKAWGFRYATVGFTWIKPCIGKPSQHVVAKWGAGTAGFRIGTGYYTRANPEECILAVRGKPKILRHDIPQLIVSPLREHSRKPDEARERIEMLTPGPYLELFARESIPGWDAFGDQAGLFDAGHVETRRQPSSLACV